MTRINISNKNLILLTILGVLIAGSVLLTIQTATGGAEAAKLEKEEATLTDQKRELEDGLVKTLSARELQEKSGELGFIKSENLVYISGSSAVAKLP